MCSGSAANRCQPDEGETDVHKDASIRYWCEQISAQTGQTWRYLKVPQARFDASKAETLAELVTDLGRQEVGPFAGEVQPAGPDSHHTR